MSEDRSSQEYGGGNLLPSEQTILATADKYSVTGPGLSAPSDEARLDLLDLLDAWTAREQAFGTTKAIQSQDLALQARNVPTFVELYGFAQEKVLPLMDPKADQLLSTTLGAVSRQLL